MATQERFGRGRYVFDGVPDGSWDLVIDDPNYERVHIPDVSPSSPPFVVAMRGRAALTLHVTNGKTGEAIEDFAARFSVRFTDGSHFSPNSFWIRMIGDPGTHMETVDGIVPGDYLLTVDVEGMPKNTIPVLGLAAGEVRSINARMFAGGAITGQVFLGDGVTSAVGATIGLYRPAMIDDGPLSPYVAPRPYQGTKPTAREWSHGRFIEDRGDFRFEGLSPGRYIARAYQSESISIATGVLEITAEETYELSLSLPPSATLSGRVLGPAEASFEGLRLVVRNPSDAKKVHADGVIQDDGSFVVSALPLGIHEVVLAGPDFKVPIGERSSSGLDGYRRDFGMVDVDEGGAHEVFDLREDFPVRNDVLVRQSGVPTPGLIAVARVPAVDGRGAGTFGLTDQHGRVRLGPLPPGEVMLWIADPNAAWSSGPIPFQIAPGRADPFVVDVTLLENRIRCLRSSGAVLRHEEVWYDVSYAGMSTSRSLKTDEEGFVSISAPEGVVGLILPNYRGDPTLIPWTRAGPPAIEVRLP